MWGLRAASINCSEFWIQAPNATCLSHEQCLALEVLLFGPFHGTIQSSCFSCTGLVYRCPFRSSNPVQFLLVFLWSVPIDFILIQSFICGREGHFDFPPVPWVVLLVEPHIHPGRWWRNRNSDLVTLLCQHSWSLPVAQPLRRCRQDRAGPCSPALSCTLGPALHTLSAFSCHVLLLLLT